MIITEYMENGALDQYLRVRFRQQICMFSLDTFVIMYQMYLCVPLCFAGSRWRLFLVPARGHARRHRGGDEVPLRHELRPQGPCRPQRPGQRQLGVQSLRFRSFASAGGLS